MKTMYALNYKDRSGAWQWENFFTIEGATNYIQRLVELGYKEFEIHPFEA